MSDDESLSKLVNASGFAFQLGIEHTVRQRRGHSWRVVSREHPWASQEGQGFIDLVLALGLVTAVVECKRARDGCWVFLVPDGENTKRSCSKVWWVAGTNDDKALSGLGSVQHLPPSYISSFCVVRGSGENDRPMLERLCSTLLASADAIAEQEVEILRRKATGWQGFFLPLIVTTADLHVCRMAPSTIDLATGTLADATYESVPFIRFQKAFSASGGAAVDGTDLGSAADSHERTVWVINAQHFEEFLANVREPPFRQEYPWDAALRALKATP